MADAKPYRKGGMFGGIPAPLDWEQGGASMQPLFPAKKMAYDNPFFESDQYPMTIPLKPHPPEAVDALAKGMNAKFGKPSPQSAQRFDAGTNTLNEMNLPGMNMEAFNKAPMSENILDERNPILPAPIFATVAELLRSRMPDTSTTLSGLPNYKPPRKPNALGAEAGVNDIENTKLQAILQGLIAK